MMPCRSATAFDRPGRHQVRRSATTGSRVSRPGGRIQLGVVAEAAGNGPVLIVEAVPGELSKLSYVNQAAPEAKTRPGLIEIELANGTRLRGDAFVNERALHRVMPVRTPTS